MALHTEKWELAAQYLEQLYAAVDGLSELFPGQSFTPDGHLVGSLGEALAAYMFGLDLLPASAAVHDAIAPDGRQVQVKLTQGRTVGLRAEPEHLIVLHRPPRGATTVIYNGHGAQAWEAAGGLQSNGTRNISLFTLKKLDDGLSALPQTNRAPV